MKRTVAGEALDCVERPLAQAPERLSRIATEVADGVVVRHRSAAQGEASVPATRPAGDLACFVQADTKAARRKRERARATGDAAAHHDRVGRAGERYGGPRARVVEQPERRPELNLATGTVHPLVDGR